MKSIWLFRFISYTYCQGTKDKYYGDMRLLTFTLPVDEDEAKYHLEDRLRKEKLEYDHRSIETLNVNITNS